MADSGPGGKESEVPRATNAPIAVKDTQEVEVGTPNKSAPKSTSQVADKSRSPASSSPTSAAGSSAGAKWSDFLDPFRYELRYKHLRRVSLAQSWGMEVSPVTADVVRVSAVTKDGIAEGAHIDKGAYVMAINGKKATNTAAAQTQLECNRSSIRIVLALKRKSPLDPKAPIELPPCWERTPENDYLIIRVDPTDGRRVGTGIGSDRRGLIFISVVLKESAGTTAGLRVGDRVVSVNGLTIIGRHQCRTLVKDMQGNPFDMIIERPKDAADQQQSPRPRPLVCEREGGEPAMGVPALPDDVAVLLESKTKDVLRSIRSARSETSTTKRPSKKKSLRVKLRKDVNKEKLKRGKP